MTGKGLQVLVYADRHLRQSVVQFIRDVVALLFEQSGPLAFADVLKHYQTIDRLSVLIAQRCAREIGPDDFAILSQEAFLHLIAADRSFERLLSKHLAFLCVVWMRNC